MMQTLSYTELKWIVNALQHEAESMENPDDESLNAFAKLAMENILSVKRKIEAALESNSKRIVIGR